MAVKVIDRGFAQTMREYQEVSKKDMKFVVNKTMRDVLLLTARDVPRASREAITSIEQQPWFPKLVWKVIKGSGMTFTRTRSRKGVKTTYEVQAGAREAKKVAKKIIRGRLRSISFLASAFVKAAGAFGGFGNSKPELTKAKGWGRFKGLMSLTTSAHASVQYDSATGPTGVDKVQPYVTKSMIYKQKDMMVYINRKIKENNARFSGRR